MVLLNFTLKQHTPMLHFQHGQPGAALRASDVKPRFDRWLIKTKWKDDFEHCKQYLVGYKSNDEEGNKKLKKRFDEEGFRALNYKMRIDPVGNPEILAINAKNATPMYFGYDDKKSEDENLKALSYDRLDLKVNIPSMVNNAHILSGAINEHIALFFMSHNFGTRATKGYGSFSVENGMPEPSNLWFSSDAADWKTLFEDVDMLYKTMRSGINRPGKMYFKSLLFAYAKSKGLRWDKKTMKENLLMPEELEDKKTTHGDPDVLEFRDGESDMWDFRDALGLSTDENWAYYGVKISKTGIGRFASPILFKPVRDGNGWKVYIVWKEVPDELKDKIISVKAKVDKPDNAKDKVKNSFGATSSSLVDIRVHPEMSIEDYLNFLFKSPYQVDVAKYFVKGDSSKKKRLCAVYDELRKNYNKK